ncbi:MAG: hypothetical protein KTR31_29985, partial [Myxococcales bacterium]|nr:hypothetical protein [Myxococcales bacterium]
MRRFPHLVLILVALLWVPSLLRAAPDRELRATDRAHAALADGDPARAVGLLRSAVRAVGDRTSKQRLRCLLGSALLADDDPGQAEAVLSRVPLDAPCGPRAAFLRAHALVALGRARDANEIHDRVGGPKLADDRDGDSAEAVAAIARKLLADPDRGRTQGMSILARTLGLRIGPERRFALARELVDTMRQDRTQRPDGGAMAEGCRAMVDALTAEDSGADRLRAAAVCTVDQAWQILSGLPPSPQRDLAMAEQIKGAGADVLRERALQRLSGDELTTLRQELGAARVAQGRLDATALLDEAPSADGERLAAGVLARAGREADAVARLDSHLQQYRSDPHRAEVLAARADLVLGLARRAAARGEHDEARRWYDELLQEHPEHTDGALAAYEAGLAARAAGDLDDARERFDRVLARWPESSAAPFAVAARARMALDDSDDSEAAFELMRRMGSRLRAAVDVAAELRATRLRIDGPGQVTRDPRVRIGVRNVETLKVALHSIDADAYVRAGQQPEDLRELDVGVVGADRTWTEPVPDYRPHADLSFDLPIEVPGPGLYTVTVSADDREARTLLLVSDLRLVAKAVGGELAVAAFDAEGRPAPGTEVLLVSGDKTREGRTDGTGLWRTPHVPRGETVLLGRRRGSPALLTLSTTQQQRMEIDLTLYTELERPLARPGSDMGIRVVARRGPSPVRGEWTLWLAQGDRNLSPWKATSDGRGVLHTQLPIPPIAASRYEILAVPPGQAERVSLGSVSVGSGTDAEAARTMTASIDEAGDGVVEVWQPDGTPAAGVVVRNGADGPTATTDSAGRATFAGPAATIPWTLNAQLVGSSHTARASRQPPERVQLRLTAEQDRLRPGERPRLALHGEGAVRVELSRLIEVATPAEAPVDPWLGPEPEPGPRGAVQWTGAPAASEVVEERVRQLEVTASEDGVPLDLPVLEPGRWRVRAMHADGWAHAAMMDLSVSISELRLVGVGDASLGERLTLGAQGEAALVTASNDRLLYAAVHGGTSRGVVTIDPQWAGDVDVTAVAPSGAVHHRDIRVDTALHVALTTEPVPGGVRVTATVTDGAGRPAAAQVALAGWDTRMERFAGAPRQLPADALRFARAGGPLVTGVTVAWEDGDPGSEIHPALLQEVRRLAEREKARNAISGLLSDNNLARAMLEDVPVPHGIGGLGTSGYGSGGGGGFGSGHGGLGQIA